MPLKHTVEEIILKNGAQGLLIDIPDATVVSYEVHFRAGNYYAPSPTVHQTAHLMEHLAFGSTKNYPSVEVFSQEFSKNGAYNNASTYQYSMSYFADCALLEWDRILDLQRQAITEPHFTQALLTAEKGNVTEELTGQANNHGRILWQTLSKAMGDPLFTDPEKLETIPAVTLEDIQHHHKYTHTLRNMRFVLAGDLKRHREAILASLEDWRLPVGERLVVPKVQLRSAALPVRLFRQDLPSIRFALHIALNRELLPLEETAMGILNHILTGTFHSRIFGKARARGICYGMGSSTGSSIEAIASWEFYGQIRPQNAQEMMQLIVDEVSAVVERGITANELREAKTFCLGGHQMRGQTVSAVSGWYAGYYFDTAIVDAMENSITRVEAITRKDVQNIAREFIARGEWGLGVIGNISEAEVVALDAIAATILKKRENTQPGVE